MELKQMPSKKTDLHSLPKSSGKVQFIEYQETVFAKWGYSMIKTLFSPIIRWIWVKEIEGLHNIPKEGSVIIASNHESYFDFLCSIAVFPRKVHYLAAEVFYANPFWRPLMKLTGQIKVDRKSNNKAETHRLVYSALSQERMIGIFPEGTRSPDGKIGQTQVGVAMYALKAKIPVVPVGIVGTYEIMSRHDRLPKFKKAKIIIGEPMHFQEYRDIVHTKAHLRYVTDRIMLKIAELTGKEYVHVKEIEECLLFKNEQK